MSVRGLLPLFLWQQRVMGYVPLGTTLEKNLEALRACLVLGLLAPPKWATGVKGRVAERAATRVGGWVCVCRAFGAVSLWVRALVALRCLVICVSCAPLSRPRRRPARR